MKPDLTPEEYEDCIAEYLNIFENSSGSVSDELHCRLSLKKIGMEEDEIDSLIKENRPNED